MSLPDDVQNSLPEILTQIGGMGKNNWYAWKSRYAPLYKALTAMGSEAAELFAPFLTPYETASQNQKQACGAIVIVRELMLTDAAASVAPYCDHADETLRDLAQSTFDTLEGYRILHEEGDDPATRVAKLVKVGFFGKAGGSVRTPAQKALKDLPQEIVIQALTDAYPKAEPAQQEDIVLQLTSRTPGELSELSSNEKVISIVRSALDNHPKMLGVYDRGIRNALERMLSPEAFAEWEAGYQEAVQRYEEEAKRKQEAQERELAIQRAEREARQKQEAEQKKPRFEKLVRDMSLAKNRQAEERLQLYETIKGLNPGERLVTIEVVLDFIASPEKLVAEPESAPSPPAPSRREGPSLEMVLEVLGLLEAIDALRELQNHGNQIVQVTASRILGDLTAFEVPAIPDGIRQKAESIARMVAAPDGAARVEGQQYMAEVGRDNVVAALIKMLADSNTDTKQRQRILRTLESLGSAAGIKAIGAARFDQDPEIATLARELHR